MALFLLLFLLGKSHFFQEGSCLVKADSSVNEGVLVVSDGETITINTSVRIATHSNGSNYSVSFREFSYNESNYAVAQLSFVGNISFMNGSIVNLTGSNALTIISQKGSIVVETDIRMAYPGHDSNETMFLGGYGVNTTFKENILGHKMYQGLGPGAAPFDEFIVPPIYHCIPSAGHGGEGGREFPTAGKNYGSTENNTLGGSGGSCYGVRGMAFGGGALELVAKRGEIIIGHPSR